MKDFMDLIGRMLISFIFFFEAYDTLWFIKPTKESLTKYGITLYQDYILYGATFLLILGATLVLIGYRSSFGATLLILYFLPLTFFQHHWWTAHNHDELRLQSMNFMKNIAIIGGLFMVLVNGSGRFSVKRLLAKTRNMRY
jgi:putative oxidoreductase